MSSGSLERLVQDFLDAEIYLQQRRSERGVSLPQEQRFAATGRQLKAALTEQHASADQKLASGAEAYVVAVDSFECARSRNDDLAPPARRLEKAQCDLQAILYGLTRRGTVQPDSFPKRLLVAVADDEQSGWALSAAAKLAVSLPARINLIHVVPDTALEASDTVVAAGSRRKAMALLKRQQDLVEPDIQCETMVREGDAATEIVSAARRWGADFIVMGTRGRGRIARFLLGSTAESVIRLAPCPVITIGHASFTGTPREQATVIEGGGPEEMDPITARGIEVGAKAPANESLFLED